VVETLGADPINKQSSFARIAAEQSFHRSQFERALDALPDGVLLTDSARRVVYANPAFAKHWNIPPSMMAARDETPMLQFVQAQLVDPEAFIREVERINPTSEASQDEVCLRDGRVLSRRSVPFEENGRFEARLWIFTDITDAREARVDALCGLPNRRAYATDYPRFVEAGDDGLIKAVAIMDIDNFKAYNDRYGHAAGDLVLRQIGSLLRGQLHPDDLVFRIGGEEFLLACKTRERADAVSFFEALCRSVKTLSLTHVGNPPHGVVTASFGVGVFRGPEDPGDLFTTVDSALYRAKEAGRNTLCVVDVEPSITGATVRAGQPGS
jgi:diguanylate cyclase (GGDEF)-like protein